MGYISTASSCSRRSSGRSAWCSTPAIRPSCRCCGAVRELFRSVSFSQTSRVIVRAMQDMDVQHQLTLIDELVTTEHIDGLALMPLANTRRARQNQLHSASSRASLSRRSTRISPDANRIALCRRGQHRERPCRRRARHGHAGARQRAADSGSAQRTLCRLAAFYRLQHRNGGEFSGYPGFAPGMLVPR